MIKLCIFDLDGTLINSLETIAHYANRALQKHGVLPIPTERYKTLVGKGAKNLIVGMLQERACYSQALFERVYRDYISAYDADVTYLSYIYPGMKESLDRMREKGILLAIVSNKPDSATKTVVAHLFGEGYFAVVTGQTEGKPLKPDPQAVTDVLHTLGVSKEACAYFGDTSTDMKTGKNASVYTVGVTWGFREEAELRAHGADVILHDPTEIADLILAK